MANRHGKKIDSVTWDLVSLSFAALGAGSQAQTAISAGTTPTTLLRIRGQLLAYVDGASAPGKQAVIAVGLIVMPEGTGTTVTSSPFSDGNAPWLYHNIFRLGYEEMVTDVIDVPMVSSFRETIDNKAMRKIRPDREVQFVVENSTTQTALSANVAMDFRFLQGF